MAAQKRSVLRQKSPSIPVTSSTQEAPPPDPIVDVPVPPGIEVTEDFFRLLNGIATRIEAERTEILQAQAMARCLADILKYSDDDDCEQHSAVATLIAKLLSDSATNLALIKVELPINMEEAQMTTGDDADREVEV